MPILDLHEKPFDKNTTIKLEIFEEYLRHWLPTFLHNPKVCTINICDFFAGPGYDLSQKPGSPLRILKVLEEYQDLIIQKRIKITILLNEKDKEKFNQLEMVVNQAIKDMPHPLQNLINARFFCEDFQKIFEKVKPGLLQGPNLFFFDQNGIKHITKDFIMDLESFQATDYLFFISSEFFLRFDTYKIFFPDFNIDKSEIRRKDIHREIAAQYRNVLPPDSKTQLFPFSIKKNHRVYGLIFGSKHLRGVEKFLTVAWDKNKINGEANFDIDDDTQMSLFGSITKLQKFENDLIGFAESKKLFTNQDILHYTLENGFMPKHANKILKKMKEGGILEHFSHSKVGFQQVYKNKDIVTFKVKQWANQRLSGQKQHGIL